MYTGTGSFAKAFARSGVPGKNPGSRSSEMISKTAPKPIYAMSENDDSPDKVGPDDEEVRERIVNREKEQFQKFLQDISKVLDLKQLPVIKNQTALDSFSPVIEKSGKLGDHAVQIISDSIARIRKPNVRLEIIVWASLPSKNNLDERLATTERIRAEVENTFWLKDEHKSRVLYRAKPWLFADAKRPTMTVVYSELSTETNSP